MTSITLVRIPEELERCLDEAGSWELVCPPEVTPEIEAPVREAMHRIHQSLQTCEDDGTPRQAARPEETRWPIEVLWQFGFAPLVLVTPALAHIGHATTGRIVQRVPIPDLELAFVYIIPVEGCFRSLDDASERVHRFEPHCRTAINSLVVAAQERREIAFWQSIDAVRSSNWRGVAWCPKCCMDQLVDEFGG